MTMFRGTTGGKMYFDKRLKYICSENILHIIPPMYDILHFLKYIINKILKGVQGLYHNIHSLSILIYFSSSPEQLKSFLIQQSMCMCKAMVNLNRLEFTLSKNMPLSSELML